MTFWGLAKKTQQVHSDLDFWQAKSNQCILESKWTFVPNLKKFPQGIPDILHSWEWGKRMNNPKKHNASGHSRRQRGGIKIRLLLMAYLTGQCGRARNKSWWWRWTLLAINCWETACFLIKASTSHLRGKNKKWMCVCVWHGCVSVCLCEHVSVVLVCFVYTAWTCVCRCACLCVYAFKLENLTLPSPAQSLSPLTLWEQFIKPLISCYSPQTIRSND